MLTAACPVHRKVEGLPGTHGGFWSFHNWNMRFILTEGSRIESWEVIRKPGLGSQV